MEYGRVGKKGEMIKETMIEFDSFHFYLKLIFSEEKAIAIE